MLTLHFLRAGKAGSSRGARAACEDLPKLGDAKRVLRDHFSLVAGLGPEACSESKGRSFEVDVDWRSYQTEENSRREIDLRL